MYLEIRIWNNLLHMCACFFTELIKQLSNQKPVGVSQRKSLQTENMQKTLKHT